MIKTQNMGKRNTCWGGIRASVRGEGISVMESHNARSNRGGVAACPGIRDQINPEPVIA